MEESAVVLMKKAETSDQAVAGTGYSYFNNFDAVSNLPPLNEDTNNAFDTFSNLQYDPFALDRYLLFSK